MGSQVCLSGLVFLLVLLFVLRTGLGAEGRERFENNSGGWQCPIVSVCFHVKHGRVAVLQELQGILTLVWTSVYGM